MNILLFGATGNVGERVIQKALARGHRVCAVARNVQKLSLTHPQLTKRSASLLDAEEITPLFSGVDVVISTVGIGAQRTATTLYSEGTKNLLSGMAASGVKRLVLLSAGVADSWANVSPFRRLLLYPILERFLGATYADMRRMDAILAGSQVEWVTVRAPRITNKPGKGKYRVDPVRAIPYSFSISGSDLAGALVDIAENHDWANTQLHIAG